jgi:hypothetical protein
VREPGTSSFGPPHRLPVVNTAEEDSEPSLSLDGCELFFASKRPGSLGHDLYRARVRQGP